MSWFFKIQEVGEFCSKRALFDSRLNPFLQRCCVKWIQSCKRK